MLYLCQVLIETFFRIVLYLCQVLMDCVLLSFSGGARAQPPRRTVWFDGSVDDPVAAADDDVIFDDVDDEDDEDENQPRGRSSLARTIARLRRRVLRRH